MLLVKGGGRGFREAFELNNLGIGEIFELDSGSDARVIMEDVYITMEDTGIKTSKNFL